MLQYSLKRFKWKFLWIHMISELSWSCITISYVMQVFLLITYCNRNQHSVFYHFYDSVSNLLLTEKINFVHMNLLRMTYLLSTVLWHKLPWIHRVQGMALTPYPEDVRAAYIHENISTIKIKNISPSLKECLWHFVVSLSLSLSLFFNPSLGSPDLLYLR